MRVRKAGIEDLPEGHMQQEALRKFLHSDQCPMQNDQLRNKQVQLALVLK
jgi:hypothetical protein